MSRVGLRAGMAALGLVVAAWGGAAPSIKPRRKLRHDAPADVQRAKQSAAAAKRERKAAKRTRNGA